MSVDNCEGKDPHGDDAQPCKKTVEDWYDHDAEWRELSRAAKIEVWLDGVDVERDGLGSSQIDVSQRTAAHAYDDEPGAVIVDLDALDRNPDRDLANLSVEDARALRDDLDVALAAIEAERERYDGAEE